MFQWLHAVVGETLWLHPPPWLQKVAAASPLKRSRELNSRIFVLTMPKFCRHSLRSLHDVVLWDVVQLKNHPAQPGHISRNGKHISVLWELGETCGVTAKRDRVSIGRGEQNFVGPSRVECDLSLTLTSTLFSVQTGGSGENQPWRLRS